MDTQLDLFEPEWYLEIRVYQGEKVLLIYCGALSHASALNCCTQGFMSKVKVSNLHTGKGFEFPVSEALLIEPRRKALREEINHLLLDTLQDLTEGATV